MIADGQREVGIDAQDFIFYLHNSNESDWYVHTVLQSTMLKKSSRIHETALFFFSVYSKIISSRRLLY